jgi:D-tyrosyl-tRNA(Tyr) deacylase
MRAVVQRVSEAAVTVDGRVVGQIGQGLVVLLGVEDGDGPSDVAAVARKTVDLRVFPGDGPSGFDRSVIDIGGSVLAISQFTLHGAVRKGRRPSFTRAARPEVAEPLYEAFVEAVQALGPPVETGTFGAMMEVSLVNDGPVTLIIETEDGKIR